jgi:hypothetical protein
MAKSRSAKFYAENPEARKKKNEYQKKYNATDEEKQNRAELNQERRKRGIYGKGGKDISHTKNGIVLKSPSANRGSKSDSAGDRRARGGKGK